VEHRARDDGRYRSEKEVSLMTQAVMGIQPGWKVHDSDGVELGAVTRLDERSIWIKRGRILRHEVEIPRSMVQEADDGHVELAVAKGEIAV
jgi:hypothetical protein